MRKLILLVLMAVCAFAQTAINDTLYLQSAAPWTGQITVSWPAFTNCAGTAIARGSRVYAVNAGVVSITLYATDCASPSIAYAAAYRTMGGADHGKSWSETWTVPSSPSIVTLAAVRQTSTLTARPLTHASTHASAGSDPVTLTEAQVTGLVSDLGAKAPLANPSFTGNVTIGGTVLVNCGGVDDTAALQAKLTAAGGHIMIGPSGGTCVITGPLTIYSNTWLDLGAAVISMPTAGSADGRMLQNYAYANPARTLADAAITSGSKTLTAASITSADVGKSIVVIGAGAGTPAVRLCATITAASAGTATLNVAAGTTVSGASASIYGRDNNIRVSGGEWRHLSGAGRTEFYSQLVFRRVDGLTVSDSYIHTTGGQYAVYPGDVTAARFERLRFDAVADGVHLNGPASQVLISDISGTFGDDAIAVTCIDTPNQFDDVTGSIADVVVQRATQITTPFHAVLLLGAPGSTLRGITLRDLAGGIAVEEDGKYGWPSPTDIGGLLIDGWRGGGQLYLKPSAGKDITVRNVSAALEPVTNQWLISLNGVIDSFSLDGANITATTDQGAAVIGCGSGTTVNALRATNLRVSITGTAKASAFQLGCTASKVSLSGIRGIYNTSTAQSTYFIAATGTIGDVSIRGLQLDVAAATQAPYCVFANTSAIAGGLRFSDWQTSNVDVLQLRAAVAGWSFSGVQQTGGLTLSTPSGGFAVGPGTISGAYIKSASRLANIQNTSADIALIGLTMDTPTDATLYVGSSTTLTLRGGGYQQIGGYDLIQGGVGAAVKLFNSDLPVDASWAFVSKVNGARAYNTNAGLACGVGPVVSNGSNWKNLYSGATY